MASRSAGFGWFVVGFLAGVGATLAAIIFATRPQPTHIALPVPPAAPGAPVITYHAPQIPQGGASSQPAPATAPSAPAASPGAPAQAARLPTPDEQTQEDAAATGMTSRARPGG
ncbi:MAG TPA: hypothetical protein VHX64_02530 [Caulobacteraceae bacterium]|jgi:hypothetical protein|nr:hypothetical protein [Caulobacteraceae bacterium]